jgi:hypothetical protein
MTVTEDHRYVRDSVRFVLNNSRSTKILIFKLFVSVMGTIFGIAYPVYEWHNGHTRLMVWLFLFMIAKNFETILYCYKYIYNLNEEDTGVLFTATRTILFFFSVVWYLLGCVIYLGVNVYENEVPLSYYLMLTLIILDTLLLTAFITAKLLLNFHVGGLMRMLPYVMNHINPESDEGMLLRSSLYDPLSGFAISTGNACCVCKNVYTVKHNTRMLSCRHKFHVVCVESWLKMTGVCPICRSSVMMRV